MTEGYLRGYLDFKVKTRTSKLREEFILKTVENQLYRELISLRSIAQATLISGKPSKDSFELIIGQLQQYAELALPYMLEKDKIKNRPKNADINDAAFWSKLLAKQQKASKK